MQESVNPFSAWENFYVIVGSAGAALTGLQFVVIALMTDLRKKRSSDQIDAFATPSIVHFCAVLLIGALLSTPWHSLSSPAIALGIPGAAGVVYILVVLHRVTHQSRYELVLEDWIFHTGLPFLAYAVLLVSALVLQNRTVDAEFGIAIASLLLLFIGIHNAWDTVTFLATEQGDSGVVAKEAEPKAESTARK